MPESSAPAGHIILKGPNTWDEWIRQFEEYCIGEDIWEYADPDGYKELGIEPVELTRDVFCDVEGLQREDIRDPVIFEQYKLEVQSRVRHIKEWKNRKLAIAHARGRLFQVISGHLFNVLPREADLRKRLQLLRNRCAPNDAAQQIYWENDYSNTMKLSKSRDFSAWLDSVEGKWPQWHKHQITQIQSHRWLIDFHNAVAVILPIYGHQKVGEVTNKIYKNRADPTLPTDPYSLIAETRFLYRNSTEVDNPRGGKQAVFNTQATPIAGKEPTAKPDENKQKTHGKPKKPKPCLCGETHWYSDCGYIVNIPGFKPNPAKRDQVDKQIREASPWLKLALEKTRLIHKQKQANHTAGTTLPTATATPSNRLLPLPEPEGSDSEPEMPYINHTKITALREIRILNMAKQTQAQANRVSNSQTSNGTVFDTAANINICNDRSRFITLKPVTCWVTAGESQFQAVGKGPVDFRFNTVTGDKLLRINNVYYMPEFQTNIVTAETLWEMGCYLDYPSMQLIDKNTGNPIADFHKCNSMLYIEKPTTATAFTVRRSAKRHESVVPISLWHSRLGHPGKAALDHLDGHTAGARISTSDDPKSICEPCRLSNASQQISRVARHRTTRPFAVLHGDIYHYSKAYNGDQYLIMLTCEATGYRITDTSSTKIGVRHFILNTINWAKIQYGYTVQVIMFDGEKALSNDFKHRLSELGVELHQSAPHSHQQNGSAERSGGVIAQTARTMRIESNLPENLWPEVTRAAVYLRNRTPSQRLHWKTPLQAVTQLATVEPASGRDKVPWIGHLKAYGCKAYAFISKEERVQSYKLARRAHIGYLVGYHSSNSWRIWLPLLKRVTTLRDVTFDESQFYKPDDPLLTQQAREIELLQHQPIATVPGNPLETYTQPSTQLTSDSEADEPSYSLSRPVTVETPNSYQQEKQQGSDITPPIYPSPPPDDPPPLPPSGENHSDDALPTIEPVQLAERVTQEEPDQATTSTQPVEPPASMRRGSRQDLARSPAVDALQHREASPQHTQQPVQGTVARAARDIDARIDSSNILTGSRSRRPTTKVQEEASQPKRTRRVRKVINNVALAHHRNHLSYYASISNALQQHRPRAAFSTAQAAVHGRYHRADLPPPPRSFRDLNKHPLHEEFMEAIHKEWSQLESKDTWSIAQPPEGTVQVPLMWVLTYKFDQDNLLTRCKARLVVRGDLQPDTGQNYYASTLNLRVFRLLMVLMTIYDLEAWQLDAVNAFVNSPIDSEIWLQMPEGFKIANKALKLRKALYGLRQSPRLWLDVLTEYLQTLGLMQSKQEPCLFYNAYLFIFFFVDDLVILYHRAHEIHFTAFKKQLTKRFEMTDIGPLKTFLGMRITRDRETRKAWISQEAYIDKLTLRYHLNPTSSRRSAVPLSPYIQLTPNSENATPHQIKGYQEKVGSAQYAATCTRVDLQQATSQLARYLTNPSNQHHAAIESTLHYLAAHRNYGLQYQSPADADEPALSIYADASFGDDPETRKSSYGYIVQIYGNTVDWKAGKQNSVTTSTTEAEIHALAQAGKEIGWWKLLLKELQIPIKHSALINDNLQTVRLITAQSPVISTKLRHVDIHQHWLRQEFQAGNIAVRWINTKEMIADCLTKPLDSQRLEISRQQLGLVDISDKLPGPNKPLESRIESTH